jgi:hypothetical protein
MDLGTLRKVRLCAAALADFLFGLLRGVRPSVPGCFRDACVTHQPRTTGFVNGLRAVGCVDFAKLTRRRPRIVPTACQVCGS